MKNVCNVERMKRLMEEADIDVVLASSKPNVGYISGNFHHHWTWDRPHSHAISLNSDGAEIRFLAGITLEGEAFWIVPHGWGHHKSWIKDVREYLDQKSAHRRLKSRISGLPRLKTPTDCVIEALNERGLLKGKIGVEMKHVPFGLFNEMKTKMPHATFVDAQDILFGARMVKTPDEIERLKRANEIAAECHLRLWQLLESRPTLYKCLREVHNTALDNHGVFVWAFVARWGKEGEALNKDYKVKEGDVGDFDIGISYEGYISDMGRTYVIGAVPEKMKKVYEIVLASRRKVLDALKPGISASDVYRAAEDALEGTGFEDAQLGGGHGVGIEVHEPPFLQHFDQTVLEPGMTLSLEQTVRTEGTRQMFLEDCGVLTEKGFQFFTDLHTDLFIVKQ